MSIIGVRYFEINIVRIKIKQERRVNAFLMSRNCTSLRFNVTKKNIERVFPNYFRVYCINFIPLNDPRVHKSSSLVSKKYSSHLLAFLHIWTHEIPKHSTGEFEWSFIFEDDVNFIEPSNVSRTNYIDVLQELIHNPEIQLNHGVVYLGICNPKFSNTNLPLRTKLPNNSLLSYKGYGWCSHAMGFTTKRAKEFWMDISSYHPIPDTAIDSILREYCSRSGTEYYTLGANINWPTGTNHYGIAFQDRKRFPSTID